jgi:uncharacterized protein YndB with AHSA1/START domain
MSDQREEKPLEHRGRIFEAKMHTTATPEQVYQAWADPAKIAAWFVDRAEGKAEPGATITWFFDKFNYKIPYEILHAEPGRRLAIRWNPPPGMSAGILDVTIAKEGGITVMRVINSGFREGAEWNEEYEGTDSGWRMAFAVLKHYLENYFGSPRNSFLAMKPAEYTFERLLPLHRTSVGLQKWLTTSGAFGEVGERFKLQSKESGSITGVVLEKTKRETALSWEEIHGTLELKGFSMGPQKMICVGGCSWGLSAARAKEIEQQMERALDLLAQALANAAHASP